MNNGTPRSNLLRPRFNLGRDIGSVCVYRISEVGPSLFPIVTDGDKGRIHPIGWSVLNKRKKEDSCMATKKIIGLVDIHDLFMEMLNEKYVENMGEDGHPIDRVLSEKIDACADYLADMLP
jgi:hypothetical protein